jgi:PAS domain-containing protein
MVENFTTESRFTVPPVFTDCGFKSGMCMRLGEAAQPYGIMGVYSTDHSTFNAEDIEFFQSIIQILMSAVIRIQAVENLKKSRSDLSHIFRIARMGNWEWNLKTGDIYWSDTIFQYIGIPKQSPSIILAESLTYPEDLKRVQNTLKQLYDEREFVQIDYRVVRPDSQIIWISNEVKVIKDKQQNKH